MDRLSDDVKDKSKDDCLISQVDGGFEDDWCEDIASDGVELRREHERRRDHFHTIGYRDGLMAGKEASAQEGFNVGFKQSVVVGYNFGLVRGITSALGSLPEILRDELVSSLDSKSQLDRLHRSVQSISTNDALKIFHENLSTKITVQSQHSSLNCLPTETLTEEGSSPDQLESFSSDLKLFLHGCPAISLNYLRSQKQPR